MIKDKIVADGLHREREANGDLQLRHAELRTQLVNVWKEKVNDAPLVLKPYVRFRMRLELAQFDNDGQNLYLTDKT